MNAFELRVKIRSLLERQTVQELFQILAMAESKKGIVSEAETIIEFVTREIERRSQNE